MFLSPNPLLKPDPALARLVVCSRDGFECYDPLLRDFTGVVLQQDYKSWFVDGKYHREDGPALIWRSGRREWWIKDRRHRKNGPAIVDKNYRAWYVNGQFHRENGPAIIHYYPRVKKFHKEWWVNDKKHRLDGPAVEYPDRKQSKAWYYHGQYINVKSQEEFEAYIKCLAFA